ncbi:MAG: hypothetical protein H6715_04040 [Myxococcales bacterium]|nr:hypothetical protein [Myxococcales bacterium]MCB9708626.1 hypothetical protein [Myxococcales bacterium]
MSSFAARVRAYLWPRRLWFSALLGAAVLIGWIRPVAHGPSPAHALYSYMRTRGLLVDKESVRWLKPQVFALGRTPVLFLARDPNGLRDVYFATAHRTSSSVWGLKRLRNLTRTSSADEAILAIQGHHAAYAAKVGDTYDSLTLLDLRGEPASWTRGWPWYARVQNAISNIQEEGRAAGFGKRRFQIEPKAQTLEVSGKAGLFHLTFDDSRVILNPDTPSALPSRFQGRPTEKAQPGMITWVVDTVRNVSWIGPGPIEWLEHRVFGIKDWWERVYYAIRGDDSAQEAADDMGLAPSSARALLTAPDPELKWPPPALEPNLSPSIRGEGAWVPVLNDPFVNSFPRAPAAFYQTFVRADPERPFARVYIVLFDPRQVQLHIVMGTKEPESATGETGTGQIPRDPATLRHLVAAFNGGFQALHGEFGMMADGRVYLPPKPWAATVAVYDDGSVGMGSWPAPLGDERAYDEGEATRQIPKNMVAMRQNLTSVVEDGVYNPWKRWWWGAAPLTASEQTYIDRTGLCLTTEGHLAFFWGQSMGAEALGEAMLMARCVRGIHLDMNSKHTGLEFYKVFAPNTVKPPLTEELDDARAEIPVPDAPGFVVRSRKAVRTMGTMRFPRWIRRDPRDFFYLTLKPVLPGGDVQVRGRRVAFSASGLPHAGWPYAFARSCMKRVAGGCTWAIRIDPQRAAPGFAAGEYTKLLGAISVLDVKANVESKFGLVGKRGELGWTYRIKPLQDPANEQLLIPGARLGPASRSRSGLGIDADGFWVVIDRHPNDTETISQYFHYFAIKEALELGQGGVHFNTPQGIVSVDGAQIAESDHSSNQLMLNAVAHPSARVIYPDNVPLPYSRWGYAQGRRVRYFPEGPPRFRAPGMQNH